MEELKDKFLPAEAFADLLGGQPATSAPATADEEDGNDPF
jgi:hypothetical protein